MCVQKKLASCCLKVALQQLDADAGYWKWKYCGTKAHWHSTAIRGSAQGTLIGSTGLVWQVTQQGLLWFMELNRSSLLGIWVWHTQSSQDVAAGSRSKKQQRIEKNRSKSTQDSYSLCMGCALVSLSCTLIPLGNWSFIYSIAAFCLDKVP